MIRADTINAACAWAFALSAVAAVALASIAAAGCRGSIVRNAMEAGVETVVEGPRFTPAPTAHEIPTPD